MKKLFFYLAALVIVVSIVCYSVVRYMEAKKPSTNITYVSDTLYIPDTISMGAIPTPVEKPGIKYIHDTLLTADSTSAVAVSVPITSKVYTDSTYRAVVSGYKATLDSMSVFKKTKVVTNTVYKTGATVYKPYKWSLGPYAGYGLNTVGASFSVGFSVHYNLINF